MIVSSFALFVKPIVAQIPPYIDSHKIVWFFIRIHYTQYFKHSQQFKQVILIAVIRMISYDPFFQTLLKKGVTEYHLIFKEGVSANTLHRMKHGEAISTKTLDVLCFILDCEVDEIIRHVKE